MFEIVLITGLSVAAFLAPIIGIMLVLLAMQVTKKRQTGFMHLVPYAILLVAMADIFFSGRSLDNVFLLAKSSLARSSINIWLVRVASVIILMASFERIFTNAMRNGHIWGKRPGLTISFMAFWLGSVGICMFFSAHPYFSHDYFYPLVIGMAVLSLGQNESKEFILALRNGLIIMIAAGFLIIPINSHLVIETTYAQGFIAGLPRLAGLFPHAVMQGVVALVLLLILYEHPLKNKTLNRVSWIIGLIALFMAQSKTSWISAIVCFGLLFSMKYIYSDESHVSPHKKTKVLIVVISAVLIVSLLIGLVASFGDVGGRLDKFLFSAEGQQLASFTGRDVIWEFALSEWANNPIFGYGPQFLNFDQRIAVGMPNATHAHNQFIDTLARSGLIGLVPLITYLMIIVFVMKKMPKTTMPLAIAIFFVLVFNSISEVPYSLFGYGVELLFQLVLFAIILNSQPDKQQASFQQGNINIRNSL